MTTELADLSLGSHFALLGFFPPVLAPQTGVESTSLEPRLWLLNVPWSLHALVSLGFCSNMDSGTISTLLLEVVGAEGKGVPGRKAESGLPRGLGFSPAVEDILVLPPSRAPPSTWHACARPSPCRQVAVVSMFGGFGFAAVPGSGMPFTCQCSAAKRGGI